MASSDFPSEFLLLPLNEMKKIQEKEYPCVNIKEIMKARRREKNKLHILSFIYLITCSMRGIKK